MVVGAVLGRGVATVVVGSAVAGALTGHRLPALAAGIVVAWGAAAYLFFTNAGRVLVAAVALLGAVLSWWVPRVTDEVLAERGEARSVVVTGVHTHRYEGRDYVQNSCTVELLDGTPVTAEAWRTCTLATTVGDHLEMVFDPDGVVAPTDRSLPVSAAEGGWRLAGLALLLAAVCSVAVVRLQP
ncbi:hypothetical protein CP966_33740 [Streptomyces galilaeus]|nr:hypothetical protein CP966_33740 [Streptomyces galilaeus]